MSDYTNLLVNIKSYTNAQKQKALDEAWLLLGNSGNLEEKENFEQIDIFSFLLSEKRNE